MIDKKMLITGLFFSLLFTFILFYFFIDLSELINILINVNLFYVFVSLFFYFLSLYFRSKRWGYLLKKQLTKSSKSILPVVIFGYMANNLIPIRIGEILRSYYLSIRENISTSFAFGTIIIERLMDVIALIVFFSIGALTGSLFNSTDFGDFSNTVPGGKTSMIFLSLFPFIFLSAIIIIYTQLSKNKIEIILHKLFFFSSEKIRKLIVNKFFLMFEGLTSILRKDTFVYTLLFSLIIWTCEALMYYIISLGLNLDTFFDSTLEHISIIIVFTSVVNLAGIIPSTAGSWGPFDFFGSITLITLGVSNEIAVAYSLLVHASLWIPPTLLGFVIIILDQKTIKKVIKNFKYQKMNYVK